MSSYCYHHLAGLIAVAADVPLALQVKDDVTNFFLSIVTVPSTTYSSLCVI